MRILGRMKVVLPDQTELELPDGATGLDAARAIGPKLAEQAVLVRSNGVVQDLRLPLEDGEPIQILTTRDKDDPDALYVLRHSSAHLLAEAVRRLYPGVKVAIGPPIEQRLLLRLRVPRADRRGRPRADRGGGRARARRGPRVERARRSTADEARDAVRGRGRAVQGRARRHRRGRDQPLHAVHDGSGEFTDLCRGPHLQNSAPIKALKLTGLAGAYWRGDEHNTQLTRIYGTAFYSQADLDAHLERLEEARQRDHRRLGVAARPLPLLRASRRARRSGTRRAWRSGTCSRICAGARTRARGYVEVRTPQIYDKELWVTSGHWEKYREHMFTFESENREFGLKPMNCPGPLRALLGRRVQLPRAAAALRRGRRRCTATSSPARCTACCACGMFSQDDAHIFCTPEQIEDEVLGCLDFGYAIYDRLGLEIKVELSTRPENKLGTDEEWDVAEAALAQALERRGLEYIVNEGDGAFYGPKIDLHMLDSLGRSWQIGTVQLDFQMPQRFGLRYQGADNAEHTPVMIHRALIGSFERFIGILIEHFAGAFPFWLAPVQVRVIPVGESHREAARALAAKLAPYRVEVDESDETVGKKIRNAEVEKIPFVIVYGDKESRRRRSRCASTAAGSRPSRWRTSRDRLLR